MMNSDRSEKETNRVEKTLIGLESSLNINSIGDEMALAAVDSHPILDQETVRIESVEKQDSGSYEVVISGEVR